MGMEHDQDGQHRRIGREDIRVTSNPTNISHARELIIGVDVKDVFDSQSSAEEVSTRGVNNTLGLSSGPRGLVKHRQSNQYLKRILHS